MTGPADWTTGQAQAAQAELDELERTDPDVAAAAASYDRMVERVTAHTHRSYIAGCRLCNINPVTEARDDAKYVGEFSSRNRQWDRPERHEAEQDRQ